MSGDVSAARARVRDFIVVTCEHGGNRIPPQYAGLFRGWQRVLRSHRGFDAGALAMSRDLANELRAPLVASTMSRLLVDLNRSLSNPRAWSAATRPLQLAEKQRLIKRYYSPYHYKVATIVSDAIASGRRVIHVSSHSFTPVLDGHARMSDVGLLYDPARSGGDQARRILEGRIRRAGRRLARATKLSVCRKGRRTHEVSTAAFSAFTLCRNRARAQSGVRDPRRQAVAGFARKRRCDIAACPA